MKKISVMGFGGWGIALSLLLSKNGHSITAWQRSEEKAAAARTIRQCPEYLPGVTIPGNIQITSDITTVKNADIIVFAAGTKATREVAGLIKPYSNPGQILVSASKGLEPDTRLRMTQVLTEILPDNPVAAISGPCHAEELSQGIVSTYVAASTCPGVAETIQDAFMSPEFRVYTNPDVIGVELGGALKNVIAIATGISDGLGFGDNTRSALMTRGIAEISRLGLAMGAELHTFSGLAGIGDLIVTCTSQHSRNRRAGFYIGQGKSLKDSLNEVHMLVEGVGTAKAALEFARQLNIPMPITEEINKVLFDGKNPKYVVDSLMTRKKTTEKVLYD